MARSDAITRRGCMITLGAAALAGLGLLALWLSAAGGPPAELGAQTLPPGAPIHGYVAADLAPAPLRPSTDVLRIQPSGLAINVSDIDVVSKNLKTGAQSAKVITNPQGYFRTPSLPPGEYQICVSGAGYASACDPQPIAVAGSIQVLDHFVLIRPKPRAIFGTVWLAATVTPCFWFRPAFDTHAVLTAKVSLLDNGGKLVAGPVNGNSLGQYVLPAPARPGSYKLHAVCESAASALDVQMGAGSSQQDMVIRNSSPQVVALELTKGAVGVRRANPGDVLHAAVRVTDLDGDTLHYRWTDDSGRDLGLPDAPAVDWPLVKAPALNTLHVQVSDGKGGFAVARRSLRAGANEILFAGSVFDRRNNIPIEHPEVHLNGVAAKTDAAGGFRVIVPDAPRFVLNVGKAGFALSSRVYYGRNTGLRIPLDAVRTAQVNGRRGGTVELPPDDCCQGCPGYDQRKPGNLAAAQRKCKSKPTLSMRFAPDSLVDMRGKAYPGTAKVEGFQYDISLPNPIPGDQGATFKGKTVRLATFGAFYIQPRDTTGQPLQMAAGKKLQISMPIDPGLLARAPAQI